MTILSELEALSSTSSNSPNLDHLHKNLTSMTRLNYILSIPPQLTLLDQCTQGQDEHLLLFEFTHHDTEGAHSYITLLKLSIKGGDGDESAAYAGVRASAQKLRFCLLQLPKQLGNGPHELTSATLAIDSMNNNQVSCLLNFKVQ